MNGRTLLVLGGAALVLAALSGWLLLAGPAPVPVPRRPEPESPSISDLPPADGFQEEAPGPEPEVDPVDPDDVPPADGYPWAVPPWWEPMEAVLREKTVRFPKEPILVADFLRVLGGELEIPVEAGAEIAAWAEKRTWFMADFDGSAAELLDAFTLVHNLDVVLLKDRVTLRARRRADATRLEEASRVQWVLARARLRAASGTTAVFGVDNSSPVHVLDLALESVPLREVAIRLETALGVPVVLDRDLWNFNPAVSAAAGERPPGEWLAGVLSPAGIAWEATARHLVLWRR